MRAVLILVATTALALACESTEGPDGDASGDAASDALSDVPRPESYHAVLIRDSPDFGCSPNQLSHGADIDAVELVSKADGSHIAWWDNAKAEFGDDSKCAKPLADKHKTINAVYGQSDATQSDNYVALSGGYIIGEFEGRPAISGEHVVVVYESGIEAGGINEPFSVHVAGDIDCAPDFVNCTIEVMSQAVGTTQVQISPF